MSRSHATRTFVLGALLMVLGACASQRPFTSSVRSEILLAAPQEKAFEAVLDSVDDQELLVNRVDHHLGVVTTQKVSLTRDVPRELGDLCLPYGLEPGRLNNASYSLRIVVRPEGSNSSTLEVTPRLRFLLSDTPEKWHDCPVEGPLERALVRTIEENIAIDPRDRVD